MKNRQVNKDRPKQLTEKSLVRFWDYSECRLTPAVRILICIATGISTKWANVRNELLYTFDDYPTYVKEVILKFINVKYIPYNHGALPFNSQPNLFEVESSFKPVSSNPVALVAPKPKLAPKPLQLPVKVKLKPRPQHRQFRPPAAFSNMSIEVAFNEALSEKMSEAVI